MIGIDDILKIGTADEFDSAAMELFRFHAADFDPYALYLRLLAIDPQQV